MEDSIPKRPHFGPFPPNFAPYWPHFAPYWGGPGPPLPLSLLRLWLGVDKIVIGLNISSSFFKQVISQHSTLFVVGGGGQPNKQKHL